MQNLVQKIKNFISKNAKDIWQSAESFAKDSNELALSGLDQNIQCLQSSPVVSGYFIEEWADFKNDLSGIIKENGESKNLEQSIKNITASTRLLLSGLERVVAKSESISFQLSLLNEKRLNEITISVQLLDKTKIHAGISWRAKFEGSAKNRFLQFEINACKQRKRDLFNGGTYRGY